MAKPEDNVRSLFDIKERTAERRGRNVMQVNPPIPEDPMEEFVPTPPPAPPPITTPPQVNQPAPAPLIPYVTIGNEKYFSEGDFLDAKKTKSPCGDYAPYAQEQTGLMRTFCTAGDFLAAGYKLPTATAPSTRGKLCPSGETYWGGKCKRITYRDIIGGL